jgi:hypothetical protein
MLARDLMTKDIVTLSPETPVGSLCTDGGRPVNAPLPGWPETLRGEAGEIYLRWKRDLKPSGFHLVARVLDFPGGMPGDIGLFLVWGE